MLLLVLVLAAAVLAARSCASNATEVSQDEAVAIAKEQVSFQPNEVVVRFQNRGLRQQGFWLVGLGIKRPDGSYERATNVLVNADTGEVAGVEDSVGGG